MELPIVDFGGGKPTGNVQLPDSLFARKYNAALAHQVITSTLSNARLATRKQKTRAEVRHTRRKMFRQKGGGRARAGHSSTPLRRGGGRAFPASPQDNFQRKIGRKMYRAAMAVILSQLARENRLRVVGDLRAESAKTGALNKTLAAMDLAAGKTLLVDVGEADQNLQLAARNLPRIGVLQTAHLLPTDLVAADVAVFSQAAIAKLAEQWA